MDEHEVDIVGPKILEGLEDRARSALTPVHCAPDLARDEDFFPTQAGSPESLPDCFLVVVHLRRVWRVSLRRRGPVFWAEATGTP